MIIRLAHPDELKRTRFQVLWPHLKDASFATLDVDSEKTAIHIAAVNDEGVVVGLLLCSFSLLTDIQINLLEIRLLG